MGEKEQPAAGAGGGTTGEAVPNPPVWQTCGQHRFYRRDDALYWECHGPMNVQDLVVLFDERLTLQRQHGRVFVVFDVNKSDSIPAESRRYAAQFKPDPPLQGAVVVFGAGLLMRTAVSLVLGAARLFGRRDVRTLFFAGDETEAWAILDRERIALSAAQPPA